MARLRARRLAQRARAASPGRHRRCSARASVRADRPRARAAVLPRLGAPRHHTADAAAAAAAAARRSAWARAQLARRLLEGGVRRDAQMVPRRAPRDQPVHARRRGRSAVAAGPALDGLRHRALPTVARPTGRRRPRGGARQGGLRGGRHLARAADEAEPALSRGALRRDGLRRPAAARRRAHPRLCLLRRPGAAGGPPKAAALLLHRLGTAAVAALRDAAHERERVVRAHLHAGARRRRHRAAVLPLPPRPVGPGRAPTRGAGARHQELRRAARAAAVHGTAVATAARALGRRARSGYLDQRRDGHALGQGRGARGASASSGRQASAGGAAPHARPAPRGGGLRRARHAGDRPRARAVVGLGRGEVRDQVVGGRALAVAAGAQALLHRPHARSVHPRPRRGALRRRPVRGW